ncbi:transporter substrate-binding domain-containing protein [Maridesulfovibrio sp.]|uniref:transporter substrate-binding domain-containing protein n=1 Tax=Maridesulfovibrio sp. TaxID=2795000 RepID=UPI003BAB6051
MKRLYQNLIILVLLITIGPAATSAEEITWFQPNFPPYAIIKGPYKQYGIDNRIIKYVTIHLNLTNSTFKTANYQRILEELRKGSHGIITPLFKTQEREQFVCYTSRPSYFVFSNGIIFNRKDYRKYAPFLLKDGTIDLTTLCKSKDFRIGINLGRSYYGAIDQTIQTYKQQQIFNIRTSADHTGTLTMLKRRRVDATFGFPVEIKYAGLNKDLIFYRVSGMPPLSPVYFGAPQNKFGYSMVRRLNRMLKETNATNIFATYYTYWLDEELIDDYYKLCREYNFNQD